MIRIFQFGPMGSGKDAVAEYLAKEHGFLSIAFADGIRSYISKNTPDYVWKSNRNLEIEVGEKHREWFGKDFWCRYADSLISHLVSRDDGRYRGVIIRDGRFDHEYKHYANESNFVPVRIAASPETRMKRLIDRQGSLDLAHFSNPKDCPIHDYPGYEIENNGSSLDELHEQIDDLISVLREDGYDD